MGIGSGLNPNSEVWILVLVLVVVLVLDQSAFFAAKRAPIVPQLFCPVSLIVKHRHSRERRTTTSPQFRSSSLNLTMIPLLDSSLERAFDLKKIINNVFFINSTARLRWVKGCRNGIIQEPLLEFWVYAPRVLLQLGPLRHLVERGFRYPHCLGL